MAHTLGIQRLRFLLLLVVAKLSFDELSWLFRTPDNIEFRMWSDIRNNRKDDWMKTLGDNKNGIETTMTFNNHNIVPELPSTNLSSHGVTFTPFEHHKSVVIATKLHGPRQLAMLDQSLCLLNHAYNYKPLYDIVVFTTIPIPETNITNTRRLVHPANITFVMDNRGLQEEIEALSPIRRSNFLKTCHVTTPKNLTWTSDCAGRIDYNWQAEFRSWHIWNHSALSTYKTMMWLDTDAFCTKEWTVDPISIFLQNDLAILFGNFPRGKSRGNDVHDRVIAALGATPCPLKLVNGTFSRQLVKHSKECYGLGIPLIHGFFHITNLDFFRSPLVQTFAEHWIGDGFLQRKYDDQAAVTIPTAILAPNRSWDMHAHGIVLDVYHNSELDGKQTQPVGGFLKYWDNVVKDQFPAAANACPITVGN